MKKRILTFGVVIMALAIVINSCNKSTENSKDQKEKIVMNTEVEAVPVDIMKKNKPGANADFIYGIGSRFNTITKKELDTLKSFNDIIGPKHAQRIVRFESVNVILMKGDKPTDVRVLGNDPVFNENQLEFMRSLDYSTNLMIWADYEERNEKTGELEFTHWTPHLTIVPEQQATYRLGKSKLINYLNDQSEMARVQAHVDPEKLRPAKLYFTVTKAGSIDNVYLDRSSFYPSVDDKMIELIKSTTGQWIPAEDMNGEPVDQELVVSFGLKGC